MTPLFRAVLPSLALVAAATVAGGCAGAPLDPGPDTPTAPALSLGQSGFQVVTLHLGAAEGSASRLSGPLTIQVGSRLPPNPCNQLELPAVASSDALAFCGVLRNPGGETLTSGELLIGSRGGPTDPVPVKFSLTLPPNPCTTLFLAGVLQVPGVGQNPGLPVIGASFTSTAGPVSSWTALGPPTLQMNDGAPTVPVVPASQQSCTVTVAH